MKDSLVGLKNTGANHIILACNTSRLFLPEIYKSNPELEGNIINIIENCVDWASLNEANLEVNLMASEGTIESKVYQNTFKAYGIKCNAPHEREFNKFRYCIEAVKQNRFDDDVEETFISLFKNDGVYILGCTELPILRDKYSEYLKTFKIIDPIEITLKKLYLEFKS